ncbi:PQQ-dependent sugar dehydrogenase [Beijerinckia sp. L45]|uniref:PQQ-dependent sugar dehydrogenase n=1 Tax=Beijerinckia sp. L45 TaxID=1641855 RepID=UPI00131B8A1E|nr:PQQ-dependent sugar dehydrogenase [Beijerinckia sp. L45]
MTKRYLPVLRATAATLLVSASSLVIGPAIADSQKKASPPACKDDGGGIALPHGFCATVFADAVGHARQMVVAADGTLYVNTWSGRYYKADQPPPDGGFIVALKDTNKRGKADDIVRFGESVASGGHGGTGIAMYKDGLYAEIDDKIVRYTRKDGELAPSGQVQTVVSGLPVTGDHPMHPIAIDADGGLFIDLGSATNACETKNRMPGSPGLDPCKEKETRGGIWRYDASKTNQAFSPAERFASGLRNGEGLSFDGAGRIYATQHGRDQLYEDWGKLYTPEQGHSLPAEELVILKKGGDYGWPECYFDGEQKKLVLAPEYGGDGGKKVGVCADRVAPVAFFPAHFAPNDMKIYEAKQFPSAYDGGAFVALHGSWNRAPAPQGGYSVVFQPLKDGKASGPYTVFADGFAGKVKEPGRADHRPSGLAIAPDGSLYISDDVHGRIWHVTYSGDIKTPVEAAASPAAVATASGEALPPEGIHPDAGREIGNLPVPAGATKQDIALGDQIFHGEVDGGTCGGCHGSDAKGGPIGPDLTAGKWLWSDGSLDGLKTTIASGVPEPKEHPGAMPPMGGLDLSPRDLNAVASYVWAVGHQPTAK